MLIAFVSPERRAALRAQGDKSMNFINNYYFMNFMNNYYFYFILFFNLIFLITLGKLYNKSSRALI